METIKKLMRAILEEILACGVYKKQNIHADAVDNRFGIQGSCWRHTPQGTTRVCCSAVAVRMLILLLIL